MHGSGVVGGGGRDGGSPVFFAAAAAVRKGGGAIPGRHVWVAGGRVSEFLDGWMDWHHAHLESWPIATHMTSIIACSNFGSGLMICAIAAVVVLSPVFLHNRDDVEFLCVRHRRNGPLRV